MNSFKLKFTVLIICIAFISTLVYLNNTTKEKYYLDKYKGEGVKVAILDSGLYPHEDFRNKKIEKHNFLSDIQNDDKFGHGTEITGIISKLVPKANLYVLRISNDVGKSNIKTLNKAFEWCLNNNIDVINLSFSTKTDTSELRSYINKITTNGIIIICSYDNKDVRSFPAEYDNVIGVKAHNKKSISIRDNIVFALGNEIKTTSNKGLYKYVSGNSYATAYVTGIVSKIINQHKYEKTSIDLEGILHQLKKL